MPPVVAGLAQISTADLADLTAEALAALGSLRYRLGCAESSLAGPMPLDAGKHLAAARDRAHHLEEALLDVGGPLTGMRPAAGAVAIAQALTERGDSTGQLTRAAARWTARRFAGKPTTPADGGLSPRQRIVSLSEEIDRLREQHAAREGELEAQLAALRDAKESPRRPLTEVLSDVADLARDDNDALLALALLWAERDDRESLEHSTVCMAELVKCLGQALVRKSEFLLDSTDHRTARTVQGVAVDGHAVAEFCVELLAWLKAEAGAQVKGVTP